MNKFLFNGYALYQDKIVFKDYQCGLLCELDTNTGAISYIENLKNYQIETVAHDCMVEQKGKLYAVGNDGKSMMIYDGVEEICTSIPMNCGIRPWGNFTNIFVFGETLFLFHREENWVTCFDIPSNNIEKIICGESIFNICSCRIGNKVWMFPRDGKKIQEFDLETKNYESHEIESTVEAVVGCTHDNNNIYLLNEYGLIYILKKKDLSIEVVNHAYKEDVSNLMGKIICVSNKIIMLPSVGETIKIVDLEKNAMEVYLDYPEDFMYDDITWSKYYTICQDEDYYYLLRKSNYLLKIGKREAQFTWIKLTAPDVQVKEKLLFRFKYVKDAMWEGNVRLNMFIENVEKIEKNDAINNVFVGSEIWKRV